MKQKILSIVSFSYFNIIIISQLCSGFMPTIFVGAETNKKELPWKIALIKRRSDTFFCDESVDSARFVLSGDILTFFV